MNIEDVFLAMKQEVLKKNLLLVSVMILVWLNVDAQAPYKYLGGELNYNFISSSETTNKFSISLNLYQLIDEFTSVNSEVNIWVFNGNDFFFHPISNPILPFSTANISEIDTIFSENSACELIPEFAFIKLSYSFEIDLPFSEDSYYFMFRNCCRITSDNVIGFGGLPYAYFLIYTEITSYAQEIQNSSPNIENDPILIFCNNEIVQIEQVVEEIDGDQLIYTFYNPVHYTNTTEISSPPYLEIQYNVPLYTYNQPFGQGVDLNLNPNTGVLNFTPDHTGKFLVGMAVREYRNGHLLSTTFRDFQVVVADCIPKVDAQILADTILNNGDYVINICDTDAYTIENVSTQTEYIQNYTWDIEGLSNNNLNEWSPTINFPEGGTYQGQLFLNQNEECPDTANIILNVTTDIAADFDLSYDTCVGGAVAFESQSFSEGGAITNLSWNFGDTNSSNEVAPQHLYQAPGTYTVHLAIENEFGCLDSSFVQFDWLPAPPIIVIAPSTYEGCSPLDVSFENLSSPIDSTYTINWDFGDGTESAAIHPEHTYSEPQTYSLYVSITSPIGCFIDTIFPNWIRVEPPPIADFSFSPGIISSFDPIVIFQDESDRAVTWSWDFDGEGKAYMPTPNHTFMDTGFQNVTLLIADEYGCTDSITQVVDIIPETTYYLPNAFTPNGDGKNDVFKGKGILDGIKGFQMTIWDRWGGKVFETQDPDEGWNGLSLNKGKEAPTGVYVLNLMYITPRGEIVEKKNSITLLR